MEALGLYLLKSTLCLAVFAAIYYFFLRKQSYFRFNRLFLLVGLIVSIISPIGQFHYDVEIVQSPKVEFIELPPIETGHVVSAPTNPKPHTSYSVPLVIYQTGMSFAFLYYLYGVYRIWRWAIGGKKTKWNGLTVIATTSSTGTFSFFRQIFIEDLPNIREPERKLILQHEEAHVRQKHWIDLLLAHTFCLLQWFNPLVYLYRKFIRDNHEYLADEAVLQHNTPQALYQAVLINHTLKIPVFNITNSFSNNQLNRIKMMKNKSKSRARRFSVLLTIPALACFLWAFAVPEYHYVTENMGNVNDVSDNLPGNTLFFLDDEEVSKADIDKIASEDISRVDVYKEGFPTVFEDAAKQGVMLVYTKAYEKERREAKKNHPLDKMITFAGKKVKSEDPEKLDSYVWEDCPIILIDGQEVSLTYYMVSFNHTTIEGTLEVVPNVARRIYGERAKNGILYIYTKEESDNIAYNINGELVDRETFRNSLSESRRIDLLNASDEEKRQILNAAKEERQRMKSN